MIKKLYFIVLPLLIAGITFGYTSFAIALVALLPLFFSTSRHAVGVFLLMYGGPLGGIIRDVYPIIPVYGLLLVFIGIVLIWDEIKNLFKYNVKGLYGMLLVLLTFGFFYLIGPRDSFATEKYTNICIHGVSMLFGYYVYEKSSKIDAEGLTQLLLVSSILMFCYVMNVVKMVPGGFFDYDWFREQYTSWWYANDMEGALVGYQHIGMLILFAVAIFFSQIKIQRELLLFYLICSGQLVLISGARQAIFGVALVLILRFSIFRKENIYQNNSYRRFLPIIISLVTAVFVLFFVLGHLQSSSVSSTLAEGDSGRTVLYLQALSVFSDHPFLGSGIGGFHAITGEDYPHNFFLELLCEMGIIGTITAIMLIIVPLVKKKQGLLHLTTSQQFYFLIVFGIFVRVLVSSNFTESIELFSAVFAISVVKQNNARKPPIGKKFKTFA